MLVLGERPTPTLKPGEVLIRVAAAGVNRPDVLQRMGNYPVPPGASDIPGLEVAGVDMLESNDGPRVIEVNSSPGLRGVEHASGVDVAQRIISHCELLQRQSV